MKKPNRFAALMVNIVLIVLAALLLNFFIGYRNYTLLVNGNWNSTKVTLEKGVWGAWATMLTKPALQRNRLNLSCWHGMQEFIYKESLAISELHFEFVSSGHSFSFFVNKTDTLSTGILFQPNRADSCRLFVANAEGKFISTTSFPLNGALDAGGINYARIGCKEGILRVSINNKTIIDHIPFSAEKIRPGFRGNVESLKIYVDNVWALNGTEQVLDEQFSPPFSMSIFSIVYLLVAFAALYFFRNSNLYGVTFFNICALLIIGAVYMLWFYWLSGLYPTHSGEVSWEEVKSKIEKPEEVVSRLKTIYPPEEYIGKRPVILFIGSSQTWGSGASAGDKTFSARVQVALDSLLPGSSFTVINCGISGANTTSLLSLYKSDWMKYRPVVTVINLAYNDTDTAVYRKNIREFIGYNRSRQIQTLLVEEPFAGNMNGIKPMHAILREEAKLATINCIAMHDTMKPYNNEGFLWWDDVHLTDFGQEKFAECITPPIIELILDKDTIR